MPVYTVCDICHSEVSKRYIKRHYAKCKEWADQLVGEETHNQPIEVLCNMHTGEPGLKISKKNMDETAKKYQEDCGYSLVNMKVKQEPPEDALMEYSERSGKKIKLEVKQESETDVIINREVDSQNFWDKVLCQEYINIHRKKL